MVFCAYSPYSSDINTVEQCAHRTIVKLWPDTPFLVRCTTCVMYNSFHGLVTIKFHRKAKALNRRIRVWLRVAIRIRFYQILSRLLCLILRTGATENWLNTHHGSFFSRR